MAKLRKFTALVLVVVMIASLSGISALANEEETEGNYRCESCGQTVTLAAPPAEDEYVTCTQVSAAGNSLGCGFADEHEHGGDCCTLHVHGAGCCETEYTCGETHEHEDCPTGEVPVCTQDDHTHDGESCKHCPAEPHTHIAAGEENSCYTAVAAEYTHTLQTISYTVTFDSNGGTAVAPQTVSYGGKAAQPSMSSTRTETVSGKTITYTFLGWFSESGTKWDFSTVITGDTTILAKWANLNSASATAKVDWKIFYDQGTNGMPKTPTPKVNTAPAGMTVTSGGVSLPFAATDSSVSTGSVTIADLATYGLTITPPTGYYVAYVVICCHDSNGWNCNTAQNGNLASFGDIDNKSSVYTITGEQFSYAQEILGNAAFHAGRGAPYHIMIQLAECPNPVYVGYDGGTLTLTGDIVGTTANDAQYVESNVFEYKWLGTSPGHTVLSLTEEAVAQAASQGFVFDGWTVQFYNEYNGATKVFSSINGSASAATDSITLRTYAVLTAQWKATVSFEVEGGTLSGGQTVYTGPGNVSFPDGTPITGHKEPGTWYKRIDNVWSELTGTTGVSVFNGDSYKLVFPSIIQTYTVTYEVTGDAPANYGGIIPAAASHESGDTVTVAANLTTSETTKEGVAGTWTFSGWTSAGADITSGSFIMPNKNVEIVGTWTFELNTYTVTYEWTGAPSSASLPSGNPFTVNHGGSHTVDVTYKMGDTISANGGVYTFSGWSAPEGLDNITADKKITGSWNFVQNEKKSATVNYVDETGNVIAGPTIDVATIGLGYDVSSAKDFYEIEFNGKFYDYTNNADNEAYTGNMPSGGVIITRVYTERTYSVSGTKTISGLSSLESLPADYTLTISLSGVEEQITLNAGNFSKGSDGTFFAAFGFETWLKAGDYTVSESGGAVSGYSYRMTSSSTFTVSNIGLGLETNPPQEENLNVLEVTNAYSATTSERDRDRDDDPSTTTTPIATDPVPMDPTAPIETETITPDDPFLDDTPKTGNQGLSFMLWLSFFGSLCGLIVIGMTGNKKKKGSHSK